MNKIKKVKRRYKLLIIMVVSCLTVFFLYKKLVSPNNYYVSIGDYLSMGKINKANLVSYDDILYDIKYTDYKYYEYKEYSLNSTDLNNVLKNNINNINYYLGNAKVVILNVGNYELNNYINLNENIIVNYLVNIYQIITTLKKYDIKDIYIFNIFNDNKYSFINKKLKDYALEFKINYVDLNTLNENEYYKNKNNYYLNSKGEMSISKTIIKKG